ncbi:hypothetical protein CWI66_11515 [Halomonas sp. 141]|uniref:hypothetical protein n=1 Tax=Halomonas sp. 141 TaxID=2056666 RepID=UPI000C2A9A5A|nr:hypothetical protein [Halomonas sp. 141]PJX13605.1 hypothetical protein CWI66_11515 [Halomonas sp. 141]
MLVTIATVLIVYRHPVLSGFTHTTGHELDGVIATSLIEHWWNVLQGNAHWQTVNYFAPYTTTLGYNDGYLLFGLIHSVFRALGADPFLAAELSLWIFRAIGLVAFWGLAHRCLGLPYWSSLAGAILFSLSSSAYLQSQHVQLLTINLAPLMAWWMLGTWRCFQRQQRISAIGFSIASILLYASWLLTAFYMAWFFALFALLMLLVACVMTWATVKTALQHAIAAPWRGRLLWMALFSALAALPFLWVYLPKVRETGGHAYHSALTFMLTPGDLFNVGEHNLLWGWLFSHYKAWLNLNPDNNYELLVGLPPFFLIGAALATGWLVLFKRRQHPLWATLAVTSFISLLLVVRTGDLSLWWLIWHGVPGASGLRAVARYAIFTVLPLCLLWSFVLTAIGKRYSPGLCLLLVILLSSEQLSSESNAEVPRHAYLQDLTSAETPPEQCDTFFVTGRRQADQHITTTTLFGDLYPHNVAAMLFAEWWGVRTINGFSTFNPPTWNFAYLPETSYRFRVRDYLVHHGLSDGACAFDLASLTWDTAPFAEHTLAALATLKTQPLPPTEQLDLDLTRSPVHLADPETWRFSVAIENIGATPLAARQPHPINLGVQLYDAEGNQITPDFIRLSLNDLLPGEQLELPLEISRQRVAGHRLKITLVQEGVAWLDEVAPPLWMTFPP